MLAMTLAIVKVLPDPVTPKSVWCFMPAFRLRVSFSMASGWSPAGLNLDERVNIVIILV